MNGADPPLRIKARWIFPVSGVPLADGTLEIEQGRIAAVHDRAQIGVTDLGPVAVLPGLINPHTHLEFSDLGQPLEAAGSFTDWIRATVSQRQHRPNAQPVIDDGWTQLLRGGCTACGEIATSEASVQVLRARSAQGVVYRELIGLSAAGQEQQLELAQRHLATGAVEGGLRMGLSPHAPYSVHPDLYTRLIDVARAAQAPVAVHLAETTAELELLKTGAGPFQDLLKDLGVWRDGLFGTGARILDYLRPLDSVVRGLIIHGNYLTAEDIEFLAARPQLSVVYCPRTHAYFGHAEHDWIRWRRRGVRILLGTDGRGSNPDLNLWHELQFVANRNPGLPPQQILSMATREAADALQFGQRLGTLDVGKQADLTVVSLAGDTTDPYAELLGPANRVVAVMRGGRWMWSARGVGGASAGLR